MAIGDKAVAAGMALVNGATTPAKDIDLEDNRTRDYIADERTARIAADNGKVDKPADGGLMARREPGSAHNIGFYTDSSSTLYYRPDATTATYDRKVITKPELDAALSGIDLSGYATQGALNGVYEGNLSPNVYGRTLSGQYRVAYVNSGGVLGWVSSSRRFKEDIETAPIDVQAVLAMEVVTFRYIEGDGDLQHGLIAEDLHDLGLKWLVDYGTGDTPQGVRYDLLALALIPAVRSLDDRLTAIETHLDALGGELNA